jgi:hypothetical protein
MAGLGTDDQKSAAHATTPIATAFKTCISHRKNGLLNRLPAKLVFRFFTRFLYREVTSPQPARAPKMRFGDETFYFCESRPGARRIRLGIFTLTNPREGSAVGESGAVPLELLEAAHCGGNLCPTQPHVTRRWRCALNGRRGVWKAAL